MMELDLFDKFNSNRELQEEMCLSNVAERSCANSTLAKRISEKEIISAQGKSPMNNLIHIESPFAPSSLSNMMRLAPWIPCSASSNRWIRLHEEILSFVDYIRPTETELKFRRLIVQEVRRLCTHIWPTCVVKTFGSMETHLLLPKSDIDICVLNVKENIYEAMDILAKQIESYFLCEYRSVRIIDNAKVPIVKFIYRSSLYNVDICINSEDGLINTATLRELLDMYPMAYPITMVVKMYLYLRRLHEPYQGGMGSYATTLLVISFLQSHPYKTMQHADRIKVSAGILLADFFRFTGFYFNYINVGLDLIDGGECFRKDGRDTRGLLIEDPSSYDNNAASAARHFGSITRAFESAHMLLLTDDPNILKNLPRVFHEYSDKKSPTDKPLLHSEWRLSRIIWITNDEHDFRGSLRNLLNTTTVNNSSIM